MDALVKSTEKNVQTALSVEDGSYFIEARRWFLTLHTSCYYHQFYSLVLGVMMVMSVVIMLELVSENYTVDRIPFVIYTDNQEAEIPFISGLTKGTEDIQISLARYLVEHYVIVRESYRSSIATSDGYNKLMANIRGSSSMQAFDAFERYMNPAKNPYSPILKYRISTTRSIKLTSIRIMPYNITPDRAIVSYEVTETKGERVIRRYDQSVEILFGMSLPRVDAKVYDFAVLDYRYINV